MTESKDFFNGYKVIEDTPKTVSADTPEFLSFIKGCQAKINTRYEETLKNLEPPVLKHNGGRRYYRIERIDNQRSAHCFIDRTNGDVLKTASWKSPAKTARGNIFNDDNGLDCMSEYGAAYLK
jgi:hypothetical protein